MAAPKAVAIVSAMKKAVSGCMPYQVTSTAIRTLVKPMTEPTDRSMPPERITKVMPTAAMPRNALSVSRLPRTRVESMFGNWMMHTAYASRKITSVA